MRPFLLALLGPVLLAGPALAADDVVDVVYLGSGKPAVIRLRASADGKPLSAQWDAYMKRLFSYCDLNKSGGLDRLESALLPLPTQLRQHFSGNLFNNPGSSLPALEQLDANRDGKITLEELKAYYTANGAGPLLVSAPNVGSGGATLTPQSDPLFQLLDTNKDGKLARAELEAAEVLLRFDDNDDELVSPTELSSTPRGFNPGRPGMMANPRVTVQLSSLLLLPRDDGRPRRVVCLQLARELIERLDGDKNGKLSAKEVPFTEEVFKEIDRNGDGEISAPELARVLSADPVGEFTLQLGNRPAMARRTDKAEALAVKLGNTRLTVATGSARLALGGSSVESFLLDQLRSADKDKRGFVTRADVGNPRMSVLTNIFQSADRNRDGKLTPDELRAYVQLAEAARGQQLVLSLNESGQGLFEALDANRDGFLSVRELRTAWVRMADMDTNDDGAISPEEFPRQATLLVGGRAAFGGFGQPTGTPPAPDRGPLWFRKMDRNGDGDVSRSEWLGTAEEFTRIDSDKDGLISLEEAEAHDARLRK